MRETDSSELQNLPCVELYRQESSCKMFRFFCNSREIPNFFPECSCVEDRREKSCRKPGASAFPMFAAWRKCKLPIGKPECMCYNTPAPCGAVFPPGNGSRVRSNHSLRGTGENNASYPLHLERQQEELNMKSKKLCTRDMVSLSMLCGVLLVMCITRIGFIPLPVIKATTMHIPVIIGAIVWGPKAGGLLGAVFGLCSIWENTSSPGLLSFAFSPFMSTEGLVGVVKSLWIALGCRIAFGVIAGWLWLSIKKIISRNILALPIVAAVATVCHTLLVMGSIYLLLAQQYALAKNVALSAVFGLVMGTVASSGIPEAIAAAVLVTAIANPLIRYRAQHKESNDAS